MATTIEYAQLASRAYSALRFPENKPYVPAGWQELVLTGPLSSGFKAGVYTNGSEVATAIGSTTVRGGTSKIRRLVIWIGLCALMGFVIPAWAEKTKEIHWREEVRLTTGEVVTVERGEKLNLVTGDRFDPGWLFDEAWLNATLPGVGKIRWQGALSPLVLNVTKSGDWYLLGIAVAYRGLRDYQLGEEKRYVAFKLRDRLWQRIPFAEFPVEFQPNLLGDTYTLFIERGQRSGTLVDFKLKAEIDADPTLDKAYKRIDRSLGQ
jgi:hypothetical protein